MNDNTSVVKNSVIDLIDALTNVHCPGLERQLERERSERRFNCEHTGVVWFAYRDRGISRLDLEFRQGPDVVGELDRLVHHVLAFQGSLGDREHVILLHFRGDAI